MANNLARSNSTLPGLLPDEEAARLVDGFVRAIGIDDGGRECLPRLPTSVERQTLHRRLQALEQVVEPIRGRGDGHKTAERALAALFAGYTSLKNANVDEMLETYAGWLSDLPAFAIVEACHLVGTGNARLKDYETGKTRLVGVTFPPTHSELNLLARPLAEKRRAELAAVQKVLRITRVAPAEVSASERAAIGDKFAALAKSMKLQAIDSGEDDRAAAAARRRAEFSQRMLECEYEEKGLEPVVSGGVVVSLTMMLQNGYRIEEVNGKPTLVR